MRIIELAALGFDREGISVGANVFVLVVVVLWLALVFWTYSDARKRLDDPLLIICATVAALFPFVGTVVYMIVRPAQSLEETRLRMLDLQAAEVELDLSLCPHCDGSIREDFLRCPSCCKRLKAPCPTCTKPLQTHWRICPFCETDLRAESAPSRGDRHGGGL